MKNKIKGNVVILYANDSRNLFYGKPRIGKEIPIRPDFISLVSLDRNSVVEIGSIIKDNFLLKIKLGEAGNEK
ncbi:hypothetical protein ACMSYV_003737 [Proteus mirabilis]